MSQYWQQFWIDAMHLPETDVRSIIGGKFRICFMQFR